MPEDQNPHHVIAGTAAARSSLPDAAVLAELEALPPLQDEDDPCWDSESYWHDVVDPYLALADEARSRRLRAAIPLLLERACFGDPFEIMRGLRHRLEAIVDPDWPALADLCLEAATSSRPGTRLWAMHELGTLRDPRARPIFEAALHSERIRDCAEACLERLHQSQESREHDSEIDDVLRVKCGRVVLLVELTEHIERMVTTHLTHHGYVVITAANGDEVTTRTQREPPGVIIGQDEPGIETCTALRKANISTPFILLDGSSNNRTIWKQPAVGIDVCLSIPFDARELVAFVERIFRVIEENAAATKATG